MRIGLFFGSFNPVHIGHLIIANHMLSNSDMDKLWMVVSPHNPLKEKTSLAKDYDRLRLLNLAIDEDDRIKASDIEFYLPKPSYTIDTLTYLKEKYPKYEFALIMGGDNIASLHKWKNYEILLENYTIYVYERPGYDMGELVDHPNVHVIQDTPLLNISASFIRKCIREGKSVKYLLPPPVYDYITGSNMYKK
ncbi:MAG: nicotinate (nicotinamide) nucleotide adenylyltransferase [Bacteroidota bacterium]